jgi:hypothetical protein
MGLQTPKLRERWTLLGPCHPLNRGPKATGRCQDLHPTCLGFHEDLAWSAVLPEDSPVSLAAIIRHRDFTILELENQQFVDDFPVEHCFFPLPGLTTGTVFATSNLPMSILPWDLAELLSINVFFSAKLGAIFPIPLNTTMQGIQS